MKTKRLLWCAAGLLVALTRAPAATLYVDAASTNAVPPFINWATAAANIQDAVDAAASSDTVLVTNGVYATGGRRASGTSLTNRVCVDRAITLRSVNGPESTLIHGMGNTRCTYLTNGATVTGFTLTNGATQVQVDLYPDNCGGGAWCEGLDAVLSNCVVAGCWAYIDGGGSFSGTLHKCMLTGNKVADGFGGGASYSTLNNCMVKDNAADVGGGAQGSTLTSCTITNNGAGSFGAGASASTLNNCSLTGNIAGHDGGGAYGCTLSNCTLTGNLTRGSDFTSGGGAYGSTLNNCLVTGNRAWGEFGYGGGALFSTLSNCTITGNSANAGGGAAGSTLNNCMVAENGAGEDGCGGGVHGSTLNNCTLTGNSAGGGGGACSSALSNCLITGNSAFGIYFGMGGGAYASTLNNCILTSNSVAAWSAGFGNGGGAAGCNLTNCMVTGNSADDGGGGASDSNLKNCTLTGNSATGLYGASGGGAYGGTLNNCIVYYNGSVLGEDNYFGSEFNYCSTTPDPGSGVGNITNEPVFVDLASGNLRLQSNSPCINAGNNAYVTAATDLDSLPRIAGGTVDIGAYEFQSPASTISYAWLQQFGLPSDGSADYVDTDHDGHNNWQEWVAGTDPTNALSVLRLAPPVITPTNVILTWTSVTNRTYTLEQATNLGGTPAFSVLRSNLVGLPGTTSWTDTNAPVSSPRFYKLRVSP